ncbi:NgoFVII family restriction endonuclease [candidate division KSB1 bacterium]|nr:NgoFVII family restriction endonuclease [candidate division KSB1 bacterium]
MPRIFDNIEHHLVTALTETLDVSFRSDFCVGYFNLRGWGQVADCIEKWSGEDGNRCRLLVGMQKQPYEQVNELFALEPDDAIDNKRAKELGQQLARDFRDQLTVGVPSQGDEIALRKLSRQLKAKKVTVKLFLKHPLHAKLYLLFRSDVATPIVPFLGSSNLTMAGLEKQGELNVDVMDQDAAAKLARWFEERWNDRWCIDISEELIEIIDDSWAGERLLPPYHIYLKMIYHLAREARAGMSEFNIPKEFQKELLPFQGSAVLIAARHLNRRGGVLVGDVVGLGKTMTASAIAKVFEEDFFLETLIICPKNLTKMWEEYVHKYRLHAKVLPISIVQNELPTMRRYRIVIIDESHNLRNREGKRYKIIQEYIQHNDSKVILLSATPYNKNYTDLSSQLRLFLSEDQSLGISPENYINSIGGRHEFQARHQVGINSIAAFERSDFIDDWRELMRLFLVRRTRSFIKNNYAQVDPANAREYLEFPDGKRSYFPKRMPKKVEYEFDPADQSDQYARLYSERVISIINSLSLPRYGLGNYEKEHPETPPSEKEKIILENLSRAGRRLMGFNRTNLFKRLESSGHAFLLSLCRHVLRNFIFIHAIDNDLEFPIGPQENVQLDDFLQDDADDPQNTISEFVVDENMYKQRAQKLYAALAHHRSRYDWIRTSLFEASIRQALLLDARALIEIIKLGKEWRPEKDRQLNALHRLCDELHKDDKILVFTQYADTAVYLAEELKKRGVHRLALVTGDSDDPTELAFRFSPISNNKNDIKGTEKELRILISTDVLSEGQNLQDGHIVVNYDLPWALIRLVQRAGRVDRIGQLADEILCYSFLPEDGIEQIIRLRGRLTQRIRQNAEVVGSDEVFFDGDPVNVADLYNEKAGIFDEDDDEEVDLSSFAFQIWKNATEADASLLKSIPQMPNVVYSTKAMDENADQQGVIVYARTADDNDVLAFVDDQGRLITQSQLTILRAAKCAADTPALEKIPMHHELVKKGLGYIQDIQSQIGGQLGKKTGARYRAYMRLMRYYEEQKNSLFANDQLKRAIDDIYNFPLRETARDTLNRQLKSGISDDDFAELVISLREEDRLTISAEKTTSMEPRIICSLGLSAQGTEHAP